MTVRLLRGFGRGRLIDVPPNTAFRLFESGAAEPVKRGPETATLPKPENTSCPSRL
jgi:hypothetical protein